MSGAARLRLAGAVAVLATTAGLSSVVQGGAWLVQAVIAVVVVVATGAGASALRAPAWAAVVAQLAALLVVVCVLFVPGQAVLGLLPEPQALGALTDLALEGQQVVNAQAAPVTPDPGLRLLTTTGAGLVAVLVDVLAVGLRAPALTGPVLLAVHAVAVVFAPTGLPWGWFAVAVLTWLVLLAADADSRALAWGRRVQQRRSTAPSGRGAGARGGALPLVGGTAVVAGTAVLAALLLPPLVPGTSSVYLVAGNGSGSGAAANSLNPLLDMRSDLASPGTADVLSYTTETTAPSPLRIVTVDEFDGDVWSPSQPADGGEQALADGVPRPPGLSADVTETVPYDITVQTLRQQWLPVPYPPAGVQVEGSWVVDTSTLNIRAQGRTATQEGQQYRVEQLAVDPQPEQLRDAPDPPADVVERYTALPEGLPAELTDTALQVTEGETTAFGRAASLQSWFRSGGGFTYSLEAPEPRSASALVDFLTERTGYCVHYASAMAVMARTLGIPARIGVGFLPGTRQGDGTWQVGLADAHAWPELYFEGVGWVRFEPTPSARTGSAPAWTVPPVEPVTPSQSATGATSSAPSTAATSAPAPSATTTAPATTGAAARGGSAWPVLVVLALLAGALAAPLASRSLVQRRRWRRAEGPAARAEAAWADLVERVGDLGVVVPASETPRQVGRRLAQRLGDPAGPDRAGGLGGSGGSEGRPSGDADGAVHRLVGAVEGARYGGAPTEGSRRSRSGGGGSTALADDVRTVVGAVAATAPRSASWRGRLLPRSGVAHLRRLGARLLRR